MNRIKCTVQYDGSGFHGFQRQVNHRTVQQELERVLTTIHKTPIEIIACSRTDANVHALGQVFHFDTMLALEPNNWKRAMNSLLPSDIYIKNVEIVNNDFHARYNVKTKEYRYYLSLNEYNPLRSNYVYFHEYPLDVAKMREAIELFEGKHDFTTFSSGNEKENKVRTILSSCVIEKDNELEFVFVGNGFLRYQIRIMVGTLIEIGEHKREVSTIKDLLRIKDRKKAGHTAKPQGLYLMNITY